MHTHTHMAAAALMANVTLFSSQTIIYHASPFSYIFCLLFRTISFYFILCYLFLFKKQSFPVSMRVLKEFFKQKKTIFRTKQNYLLRSSRWVQKFYKFISNLQRKSFDDAFARCFISFLLENKSKGC